MGRLAGTPKRVTIDGTVFDVTADANFTINPDSVIEGQATSGNTMHKVTKQVQTVEGVTLSCGDEDHQLLLAAQRKGAGGKSFSMSYTLATGSVYRNTGKINIESRESDSNTVTLMLIPDSLWSPFLV